MKRSNVQRALDELGKKSCEFDDVLPLIQDDQLKTLVGAWLARKPPLGRVGRELGLSYSTTYRRVEQFWGRFGRGEIEWAIRAKPFLTDTEWAILRLQKIDGWNVKRAAAFLGISYHTALVLSHRANGLADGLRKFFG